MLKKFRIPHRVKRMKRNSMKSIRKKQLTLLIFLLALMAARFKFWERKIGSTAGKPTRVSRSAIKADLSLTSSGESHPNEGLKFTSSNHGFSVSSISMSNPNSSKVKTYIRYMCLTPYIMNYAWRNRSYSKKVNYYRSTHRDVWQTASRHW